MAEKTNTKKPIKRPSMNPERAINIIAAAVKEALAVIATAAREAKQVVSSDVGDATRLLASNAADAAKITNARSSEDHDLLVGLTEDYSGHSVPQNILYDIGAYEYGTYKLTIGGKVLTKGGKVLTITH